MNRPRLFGIAALISLPALALAQTSPKSQIPFVGCKSDGQMGPQDAPTGSTFTTPGTPQTGS